MTTPAPGGRPSPLRVGGLALIGVAVVAAIIGLTSLAGDGGTPTAAPTDATPTVSPPPEPAPPPAPLPGEQVPPGDAPAPVPPGDDVPVPRIEEPSPADRPGGVPPAEQPGAAPPEQPAPAPGAQAAPPAPEGAPQAPAPGPADGGAAAPAPAPNGAGGGPRAGDVSGNGAGKGATSSVRAQLRVYNNSTISGLATRAAEDFRRQGWPIDEIGNYPHGIIPTSTVYFRPGTDEEEPARVLGEQFGMRVSPRFEGLESATPGIIVIVTRDYGR